MICVVIHGSALTSPTPRDVDAVWWSSDLDMEKRAHDIVAAWAANKGFGHLPIDLVHVGVYPNPSVGGRRIYILNHLDGNEYHHRISIPSPVFRETPYQSIGDSCIVTMQVCYTIASILRAGQGDVTRTRAAWAAATLHHPEEVTIATNSEDGRRANLEWGGYTSGWVAVQNALIHSSEECLMALPCGEFLQALKHRGWNPEGKAWIRSGTGGGTHGGELLICTNDGVRTQHGIRAYTYLEAMTLLA